MSLPGGVGVGGERIADASGRLRGRWVFNPRGCLTAPPLLTNIYLESNQMTGALPHGLFHLKRLTYGGWVSPLQQGGFRR